MPDGLHLVDERKKKLLFHSVCVCILSINFSIPSGGKINSFLLPLLKGILCHMFILYQVHNKC